jgi:hypothetical protein
MRNDGGQWRRSRRVASFGSSSRITAIAGLTAGSKPVGCCFRLDASVSQVEPQMTATDDQRSCGTTTSALSQPLTEASVSRSSVDALGTRPFRSATLELRDARFHARARAILTPLGALAAHSNPAYDGRGQATARAG